MASCMAYLMGVSLFNIQEVIREFSGVEHRIEYVDTIDNVRFYNDLRLQIRMRLVQVYLHLRRM